MLALNGEKIKDRSIDGALFDSSYESILLSQSEFDKFKEAVTSVYANLTCTGLQCYANDPSVTCSNFTSSFPLIEIQIDKQVYALPPLAYCFDYALGGTFMLGVGTTIGSNYILGTTFMRAFYTEFDL
jgi:hypothetical protein